MTKQKRLRQTIRGSLVAFGLVVIAVFMFALPGGAADYTPSTTTPSVLATEVTRPPVTVGPRLPHTGTDTTGLVRVAVAIVALGGGLILLTRWRRPEGDR